MGKKWRKIDMYSLLVKHWSTMGLWTVLFWLDFPPNTRCLMILGSLSKNDRGFYFCSPYGWLFRWSVGGGSSYAQEGEIDGQKKGKREEVVLSTKKNGKYGQVRTGYGVGFRGARVNQSVNGPSTKDLSYSERAVEWQYLQEEQDEYFEEMLQKLEATGVHRHAFEKL